MFVYLGASFKDSHNLVILFVKSANFFFSFPSLDTLPDEFLQSYRLKKVSKLNMFFLPPPPPHADLKMTFTTNMFLSNRKNLAGTCD